MGEKNWTRRDLFPPPPPPTKNHIPVPRNPTPNNQTEQPTQPPPPHKKWTSRDLNARPLPKTCEGSVIPLDHKPYKCVSIDLIYNNEMILAAPFDNSSQVKGHRRSLEQQKENLRVLFLPRGRARRAAVEHEKTRIDSRADDLRIAAEIGQAQHIAILHEL